MSVLRYRVNPFFRLAHTLRSSHDIACSNDDGRRCPQKGFCGALEGFIANDQETVIKLIDAMIVKQRVESAVLPIGRGKQR
jgi:hypothetical protein